MFEMGEMRFDNQSAVRKLASMFWSASDGEDLSVGCL